MTQATVDRRDTVADPDWGAVARRAERYGPWNRSYDLFRRWQRDGTWQRIFVQLQAEADAKGLITGDVSVDSTIARAHQHAAGARKKGLCRKSLPVASPPSRRTTASGAREAG